MGEMSPLQRIHNIKWGPYLMTSQSKLTIYIIMIIWNLHFLLIFTSHMFTSKWNWTDCWKSKCTIRGRFRRFRYSRYWTYGYFQNWPKFVNIGKLTTATDCETRVGHSAWREWINFEKKERVRFSMAHKNTQTTSTGNIFLNSRNILSGNLVCHE